MSVLKELLSIRNIIIVIFTPIVLLPLPLVVETKEATCAYVVIIMAVFWITEAMPIAVTSLLPIILFPMVGLMEAKKVSEAYINDTSMLFVGGLIMASAIEHWNIHRRIALGVLMIVGAEPHWLMLGLMLPTWFLSMWISNTATTAMMIPIANAVLVQLKDAKGENKGQESDKGADNYGLEVDDVNVTEFTTGIPPPTYGSLDGGDGKEQTFSVADEEKSTDAHAGTTDNMGKALSLAIAYSANVGGIGCLTGTGPNVIMKGQSEIIFEEYGGKSPVTFTSWMQFCLPLSAIMVIILWIWLQIFFLRCKSFFSCCTKKDRSMERKIKEVIRSEYEKLGPVTFGQAAVIGHFILMAVLWITRDLSGAGGWGEIFLPNTVSDSTPSILLSASMFVFPSALPRIFCCRKEASTSYKPLMAWNVAEKKVPWGVVLLLGGGFALAKGSEVSGLSDWLGDQLTVFSELDTWVIVLVLCYIVAGATEVTSNTAICTLIMPIMAQLALKLNLNPLYFMFPTAIATSFAFMLPVATPPNAVVFSYGYVRVVDMVTTGFFMNIIAVLVLVGATESWGNSIFDFRTQPDIFQNASVTTPLSIEMSTCTCEGSTASIL